MYMDISFDYNICFREKLYATKLKTDYNPIADAVINQCPNLSDQIYDPFSSRLSGTDILRILCDEQCEEQKKSGRNNITIPSTRNNK